MNRQALDTPWKISNQFHCWAVKPIVRLLFAIHRIPWQTNWRFYGIPVIQKHRSSWISFGPGLQLRSTLGSNPLGPNHPVMLSTLNEGARLEVGANFAMTGGALCAAECILIGDNVAIGANTTVIDTDFHPLDPEQRKSHPQGGKNVGVTIEDNVFIGMNCLILKGVRVGTGSVIGAGSVVSRDVLPNTLVAGNPAVQIREI